MIVKTHDVFCDSNIGPQCVVWCAGASCTDLQGGAREARRIAKRYGWVRTNSKDLCPSCQLIPNLDEIPDITTI